jgi:hypothetical protein
MANADMADADTLHLSQAFPNAWRGLLLVRAANRVNTHFCPVVGHLLGGQIETIVTETIEIEDVVLEVAGGQIGISNDIKEILDIRFVRLRKRLKLQQITHRDDGEKLADLEGQFLMLVGTNRHDALPATELPRALADVVGDPVGGGFSCYWRDGH